MPIVLRKKDYRTTIWHEDIHIWQQQMAYEYPVSYITPEDGGPAILRAARNENIQEGDFTECKRFLESVFGLVRREMRVELPAYLWSKEYPGVSFLDDPRHNLL
jgi:hypothetical protein